ncbi:hypothetical protein SAMN05444007_101294 [Cribrihabitans marinus]|uniref:Uncharacterized protein n=1 Tax=Cribrihabitans marinus TaxID=1227549 RepID=A0A1H6R1B0_9RHOB|nr:hypothetical protein [Cribrihabitans marinus]GGH19835.1 hypothetical protein GCM10010973_03400 [Cribrihabitans marinus]SEI47034.1 hypothetical protein SAMN05444007_101294 [Cribrihabitans marinus]
MEEVIAVLDDGPPSPEAFRALSDAVARIDFRLEIGMRELARRAPEIAAILAETDAARQDVMAALFSARFGLAGTEAPALARMDYALFLGTILLDPTIRAADQTELQQRFEAMIQAHLREPGEDPSG